MTESARIASLETQVRTLKRMLYGVFGLVVAGAVLGSTSLQTVPDVIQAKKFEVVNDDGKVLVELDSLLNQGTHHGYVRTKSSNGGILAEMIVGKQGGIIRTKNGRNGTLVEIGATTNDEGAIRTLNGKGGTLVSLVTTDLGAGSLLIENGKGGTLVNLGSLTNGSGYISTENGKGATLVQLGVAADGGGVVITSKGKNPF